MERKGGLIRRGLIAVGVAAVATSALATLIAMNPAGAGPQPNDISQFTVFGTNSVHIGFESTVTGLVGSINNREGVSNPSEALHLSGGALLIGDARIVQDVNLQNETGITGSVTYAGTLQQSANSSIGHINKVANAAAVDLPSGPIPTEWPNASQYCATNHTPDINNANGTTVTLTPGTWGDIKAGGQTTLNFNGAGDYYLDNLDIGSGITINFTRGISERVSGEAEMIEHLFERATRICDRIARITVREFFESVLIRLLYIGEIAATGEKSKRRRDHFDVHLLRLERHHLDAFDTPRDAVLTEDAVRLSDEALRVDLRHIY